MEECLSSGKMAIKKDQQYVDPFSIWLNEKYQKLFLDFFSLSFTSSFYLVSSSFY